MRQQNATPTRKLTAASATSMIVAILIVILQHLGYIDMGEAGIGQIDVLTPFLGLLVGPIVGYFVPPSEADQVIP